MAVPTRSEIARWFRESREAAGISRPAAAAAIGISAKQLERLELGHFGAKAVYVMKAAQLYRRTPPGEAAPRDGNVPRGTLPEEFAGRLRTLERDLARLGATDEELDYLQTVVSLPSAAGAPATRERLFHSVLVAAQALVVSMIAARTGQIEEAVRRHPSVAKVPTARGKPIATPTTDEKHGRGKAS